MNSDVLLAGLTDNSWLYAGIAALLPDQVCPGMTLSARPQLATGSLPVNCPLYQRVSSCGDATFE